MKKTLFLAAAMVASVMTGVASAAVLPVSGDAFKGAVNSPGPLPGRDDINAALNGPDGDFYSLGLGGLAVFDFGQIFGPSAITISEVTFNCKFGGPTCSGHGEAVELLVSTDYLGGGDLSGFVPIGNFGNADAQNGVTMSASGFRYVAVRDISPVGGNSFDGFDVDAISVAPIPLPPAGMLLAGGLAGLATLRIRARQRA